MPIAKDLIGRNAACNAIVGQLNTGSLYSAGHLSIYGLDSSRITWNQLSNPAFGASVDGTATAYPISDATAFMDGTASTFTFENRDGSAVWHGNVTLNGYGGSLQLESIQIAKDTTVGITSARYVVPA